MHLPPFTHISKTTIFNYKRKKVIVLDMFYISIFMVIIFTKLHYFHNTSR